MRCVFSFSLYLHNITPLSKYIHILKTDSAALTRIQWGPREIRKRLDVLYILLYNYTPLCVYNTMLLCASISIYSKYT